MQSSGTQPLREAIVSIATAPGRGAVGVVRVSGIALLPFVQALLGRLLEPRFATLCAIRDAAGECLDEGLALFFNAPHSYTGEDVLELQMHGGQMVLHLVLQRCLAVATAMGFAMRLARAGEFTERAYLNDKLDLVQAEAVADLIDASTQAAVRSAARSLCGVFSAEVHVLRDALVGLRMLVEATLDFPEEEVDFLQSAHALIQLERLQAQLARVQRKTRQGSLLREGIRLVIAGQPNAGKSSLLNALAGAEVAIVTPIAGTTRDVVQQTIEIEGVAVHVLDTAGLRTPSAQAGALDVVEKIGIERAWAQMGMSDVIVFLHDVSEQGNAEHAAMDETLRQAMPAHCTVLDVWSKADLGQAPSGALALSTQTGEGLALLRQRIVQAVGWQSQTEGLFIARERHVRALAQVEDALNRAQAHLVASAPPLDLLAEELRLAQNALGALTGEFTADDLLGEIFSKFCIGK